MAGRTSRAARRPGAAAGHVHRLSTESRPGREHVEGRAPASDRRSGHLPGASRASAVPGPVHPMLFQGQEFGASSPWLYFADHEGDLGRQVRKGRAEFLSQFPSIAAATDIYRTPWTRPHSSAASSTRPSATRRRRSTRCIGDLLALRREGPGISQPATPRAGRRSADPAGLRPALLRRRGRRSAALAQPRCRRPPRSGARAAAGATARRGLATRVVQRGAALRQQPRHRAGRDRSRMVPGRARRGGHWSPRRVVHDIELVRRLQAR